MRLLLHYDELLLSCQYIGKGSQDSVDVDSESVAQDGVISQ